MSSELVNTPEENNKKYIQLSKTNIDNAIHKNNYKNAFFLFIMVLERLDNNDKVEFVNYYSKKLNYLASWFDPIEDIRCYKR
jgi:hypothetical protein